VGRSERERGARHHTNQTRKNYKKKKERYLKSKGHCRSRLLASGCGKSGVIMSRGVIGRLSPLVQCRLGAQGLVTGLDPPGTGLISLIVRLMPAKPAGSPSPAQLCSSALPQARPDLGQSRNVTRRDLAGRDMGLLPRIPALLALPLVGSAGGWLRAKQRARQQERVRGDGRTFPCLHPVPQPCCAAA